MRGRFERRCEDAGKNVADVLRDELGVDPDSDAFWAKVKSNLQAGRLRKIRPCVAANADRPDQLGVFGMNQHTLQRA